MNDLCPECRILLFEAPADFDIQEYLAAEPHTQPRVQVRLRFTPEAALMALDDRAFWETVEEQPDGSVIVIFAVPSLEWAARTVLSFGSHVIVLEPEELRCLVNEQARAVIELYRITR